MYFNSLNDLLQLTFLKTIIRFFTKMYRKQKSNLKNNHGRKKNLPTMYNQHLQLKKIIVCNHCKYMDLW